MEGAVVFPQALKTASRASGTLRTMPKTLALIAAQRQKVASMSTKPLMIEQHTVSGDSAWTFTRPIKLPHTLKSKILLSEHVFAP